MPSGGDSDIYPVDEPEVFEAESKSFEKKFNRHLWWDKLPSRLVAGMTVVAGLYELSNIGMSGIEDSLIQGTRDVITVAGYGFGTGLLASPIIYPVSIIRSKVLYNRLISGQ